ALPHQHRKETPMKSNRFRAVAAVVALVAAAGVSGCRSSNSDSGGDAASTPKVKIMVGGIDKVIYLPAMLTQQLGYFKDAGVDVGMTTAPTIAQVTDKGLGKVLIDMRTEEGTKAALGGLYPAASMYMDCSYVEQNPKTVQKVVDACVRTMKWISTHDAADIAA